jgi:hypothetical protein
LRPIDIFFLEEGGAGQPTIVLHYFSREESSVAFIGRIFDAWNMPPFNRKRML